MEDELSQVGVDIYGMHYYFKHFRRDREMLALFEKLVGSFDKAMGWSVRLA